jgi:hypothetical protein
MAWLKIKDKDVYVNSKHFVMIYVIENRIFLSSKIKITYQVVGYLPGNDSRNNLSNEFESEIEAQKKLQEIMEEIKDDDMSGYIIALREDIAKKGEEITELKMRLNEALSYVSESDKMMKSRKAEPMNKKTEVELLHRDAIKLKEGI